MKRKRNEHILRDGVELKRCSKCKVFKLLSCFYRNKAACAGREFWCKLCHSQYSKEQYIKNPKIYNERNAKCRLANLEKYREKSKQNSAKWARANREKVRAIARKCNAKRRSTLKGKLADNFSSQLYLALKGNKAGWHWEDLVNYTLEDLIKHLKKTMPEGYTWKDYLSGKLHIDHIVPVSVFNFEKSEDDDFKRCWTLKNLQLLPALENIKKKNKLDKHFQPSFIF